MNRQCIICDEDAESCGCPMPPKIYLIQNYKTRLWWSNDIGWVNLTAATIFTVGQRCTLNLPMEGEWVPFSEVER